MYLITVDHLIEHATALNVECSHFSWMARRKPIITLLFLYCIVTGMLVFTVLPSVFLSPLQQQQNKIQHLSSTGGSNGVHSKVLIEKLSELEAEIERFRVENASLECLRKERVEVGGCARVRPPFYLFFLNCNVFYRMRYLSTCSPHCQVMKWGIG